MIFVSFLQRIEWLRFFAYCKHSDTERSYPKIKLNPVSFLKNSQMFMHNVFQQYF